MRQRRALRDTTFTLAGLALAAAAQADTVVTKEGPAGVSVGTVKQAKSAWDAGDWIGVDLSASIDVPHFSAPTGTTLKNEPNVLGAFELRLLRNSVFVWTYKRTGETAADEANQQRNAARILKLEWNLHRMVEGLPVKFTYGQQVYNTYVTAQPGRVSYLITENNTTAAGGSVSASDAGVFRAATGERLGLKTTRERFELLYAARDGGYSGLFIDRLKKPWEDPTASWTDGATGQPATVVYGDTELRAFGFTVQQQKAQRDPGWNLAAVGFDLGLAKINLTKNYSLSKKLDGQNYTVWKMALNGETSYDFFAHGVHAYVGAYARIDSYRVQQKNAEQTIGMSADRVFGLKAGMVY